MRLIEAVSGIKEKKFRLIRKNWKNDFDIINEYNSEVLANASQIITQYSGEFTDRYYIIDCTGLVKYPNINDTGGEI